MPIDRRALQGTSLAEAHNDKFLDDIDAREHCAHVIASGSTVLVVPSGAFVAWDVMQLRDQVPATGWAVSATGIVFPTVGLWEMHAQLTLDVAVSVIVTLGIFVNGVQVAGVQVSQNVFNFLDPEAMPISSLVRTTDVADEVSIRLAHNSGAQQSLTVTQGNAVFKLVQVGE